MRSSAWVFWSAASGTDCTETVISILGELQKMSIKKIARVAIAGLLLAALLLALASCGNYDCATCKDRTKISCTHCGGDKEMRCSLCGGDGIANCALCFGTGRRTCFSCGGTGSKYEYDFFAGRSVFKPCYSCVGGSVFCASTYICSCGDGKTACTACDENGRIDCPDCKGK